ncbi:tectonin beta-propeller repeat-containing protein 2-like, partial [Saccostrea cucullata]|uniref:tectonin beta-propeller repeat-containing protein 2-like n=1 Tax=Saccostrea cuccullata TaxID=36930 RepID=UPI002ED4E709
YACRPGARIWKADMNGTVSNTYLFKELLNSNHSEIQLLYKNGIPASRVSDHQFGPLLLYMEKYLVTWNESSLYVLSPEDNSVVGSQRALGAVVDVVVSEDEIFILRKNNERNLVRVAVYPEKKGESLYHKLLHEKEKYALMRQSAPPVESTLHVNTSQQPSQPSPLDFIQNKLKSTIESTGGSIKSGVEHLLSSMDHLEDSVEITEHEIDHRDHPHAQPPQDLPPVIKRETELHQKLPPVVKLETPDLLTVEIFTDNIPSSKKDTVDNPDEKKIVSPTTRFNPFLKEDLETNSVPSSSDLQIDNSHDKSSIESTGTLIPRGPSGVKVQATQDGSAKNNCAYSSVTVTEEKLSSAVGDDDIVFNSKHKRHKKKKKGLKGDRDSTHSPYLSGVLDQENTEDSISLKSSDTISIKSDISEGPYFTEELQEKPKFMTVVDAEGHVKKMRSRESSPAPSTKRSHSAEKSHLALPLQGMRNSSCESLSKSLEEFEKEITSLDNNKTGTHKQEVELEKKGHLIESKEIHVQKDTETSLAPKKEKQILDVKDEQIPDSSKTPKEIVLNTALSQITTSVTEAEKILLSDKKEPSVEKLTKSSPVSNSSSENSLLKSPAQKDPSLFSSPEPDDFYKMFTSNSNVTSQKDVTEHPLMPSTTEDHEENEIVSSGKDDMEEPSYKVINNWSEIFTPGNLSCLCLTDTHIWHVDRSSNLWHCSLTNPGLKWQKANGYAKMIAVSRSGSIVWRLYKDTVYAGTKLTAKHPEGLKWIEAVREVQYISVDESVAWYLKTNGDVVMQKGLSRDRPCFKAVKITCDFKLTQIACYKGVVLGLTDQCQLVYRVGITKECVEGKEWKIIKCKCSQEMLFSAIAFGVDRILWALDVLNRIWFTTGVTMETPTGDGNWWEVPVSEIVVKDVSGIDALRSLAEKFDPQKLASLISSQTGGLITAGKAGVWVCPEFKNLIQICRGVIQGHAWEVAEIPGIVSSVIWKTVTAQASDEGLIWASQPNGDIYTFSSNLEKCSMVESPSYRKGVLCLCVCRDAVWVLTEDNQIFIRNGIRSSNPQGSGWCKLDLTQLGDTVLTSISCGTVHVWAVDTQGVVYQRIGVKAPTSHSLNAAWLPVDMGRQTSTVFTNIATGPKDFMVWAIDNRRQVYARKGVTEDMPIGEDWIHVPGTLATQLTVSKKCVWALNPNGEILCRFGISMKNPTGDYWRKVPGVFDQISVSHSDQMWAVSQEGQLHRRFTKYLNKNSASDQDKLLPKRSSTSISSDDGWELL